MPESEVQAVRLLVVSREPSILRPLWSIGEMNCWQLETAGSAWEALERLQSGALPDLLLLELPRSDGDSLHILRWLRRMRPSLPIVLLSHADDAGQQKEALRLGAKEYLVRPIADDELEHAIRSHIGSAANEFMTEISSEDVEQISEDSVFVGASQIMRKLRAQAELLAEADVPALIFGEGGSGKHTIARLIHKLSIRSEFSFLKVNCGALPDDLLQAELFGVERPGAPASARSKPGKLELCEKGTILLDDIEEMPDCVQFELMQVLQNKYFHRQGGGSKVEIDVRILAATSANIERALSEGKLREDLYYRLSAFTIHVPPLRQRREELPLLLRQFMHQLAKHYGLPARSFHSSVISACQQYSWPGNLKELESFVKRYLVMGEEVELGKQSLNLEVMSSATSLTSPSVEAVAPLVSFPAEAASGQKSLRSLIQNVKWETERNAISAALEKTGWNRKAAARLLKISYRTILYKIEHYRMSAGSYASPYLVEGSKDNGNGHKGNGRAR